MEKYALLNIRGFPLISEKLASFMCMYRFIQWQIAPSYSTYNNLHEGQTPRPSQLICLYLRIVFRHPKTSTPSPTSCCRVIPSIKESRGLPNEFLSIKIYSAADNRVDWLRRSTTTRPGQR